MVSKKIQNLEKKIAALAALATAPISPLIAQKQQTQSPRVTAVAGLEFFTEREGAAANQYMNRWFSQFRARVFEAGKFQGEVGTFFAGTNRLFVELPSYVQTFHEHFGASMIYSPNRNLSLNLSLIRFNTEISNSPLTNEKGERPMGGAYNALSSGLRYSPNTKTSFVGEVSFKLLDTPYIGRTRARFVARTRLGSFNLEASLHRIEHGEKQQTYYKPFYPWQLSIGHRVPGTIVDMNISYGDRNVLDLQENQPQPRNIPLRTLTIGATLTAPYSH